jgi:hypothetical protein
MNGYDKYTKRLDALNGSSVLFAASKVSKQRYSAKRRGIDWKLHTDTTINRIVNSKTCALSGRELIFEIGHPDSPSIDRKNSDLGYTSRNTRIVTTAINIAKNDLTEKEFIGMCCNVAEQHGWINPNNPIIEDCTNE